MNAFVAKRRLLSFCEALAWETSRYRGARNSRTGEWMRGNSRHPLLCGPGKTPRTVRDGGDQSRTPVPRRIDAAGEGLMATKSLTG